MTALTKMQNTSRPLQIDIDWEVVFRTRLFCTKNNLVLFFSCVKLLCCRCVSEDVKWCYTLPQSREPINRSIVEFPILGRLLQNAQKPTCRKSAARLTRDGLLLNLAVPSVG